MKKLLLILSAVTSFAAQTATILDVARLTALTPSNTNVIIFVAIPNGTSSTPYKLQLTEATLEALTGKSFLNTNEVQAGTNIVISTTGGIITISSTASGSGSGNLTSTGTATYGSIPYYTTDTNVIPSSIIVSTGSYDGIVLRSENATNYTRTIRAHATLTASVIDGGWAAAPSDGTIPVASVSGSTVNWIALATGAGVTNVSGTLSANLVAGSNITLTTNSNGQISIASASGAVANTVLGSGTTVANDIAVFTDTTHTNIARSSSAGRLGDNSSATYTLTIDGSGTDWNIVFNASGIQLDRNLIFGTDNTYDIGASGATRPRSGYFGTDVTVGGVLRSVSGLNLNVGQVVLAPGGAGTLNITGSADPLIRIGGTSSSFPALKRSSTNLQVRLADDSAFADIHARRLQLNEVTAGGTPDSNTIRVYAKDSGGTSEAYMMDEAGNESLQTPHPDDAPVNMEDRQDGLQDEFAKNINYYIGKVEWINITRLARFNQRLLNNTNWLNSIGETNLAAMSNARRRVYLIEDFSTYNTRTGTTNPLVQLTWATVQQQHQDAYDAARTLELQAYNTPITNLDGTISQVNTNVAVRPVRDIRKPKPTWMP